MADLALVLDPDGPARESLALALGRVGYQVVCAVSSRDALARASSASVALIIADSAAVGAVDAFVHWMRQLRSCPAVIITDADPSAAGAVAAFRGGAFDYLPKTCHPDTLLEAAGAALARRARERYRDELISAVGERLTLLHDLLAAPLPSYTTPSRLAPASPRSQPGDAPLIVGSLTISRTQRGAQLDGRDLSVTPIEHRLLVCLAEQPGRVRTYAELARHTHGFAAHEAEAAALLKTHVRNLRRKLPPGYLVSERGTGYMLVAPAARPAHTVDGQALVALALGEKAS